MLLEDPQGDIRAILKHYGVDHGRLHKALNQAIANADRADQVINIAEGGLQEVSNLLSELQGLITASASGAGLSVEEKQANQLQIDSILQTIDRISSATNFQGIKLLNEGGFNHYRVAQALLQTLTADSFKPDELARFERLFARVGEAL